MEFSSLQVSVHPRDLAGARQAGVSTMSGFATKDAPGVFSVLFHLRPRDRQQGHHPLADGREDRLLVLSLGWAPGQVAPHRHNARCRNWLNSLASYSPNAPPLRKPRLRYSARAGSKAAPEPVSRLIRT